MLVSVVVCRITRELTFEVGGRKEAPSRLFTIFVHQIWFAGSTTLILIWNNTFFLALLALFAALSQALNDETVDKNETFLGLSVMHQLIWHCLVPGHILFTYAFDAVEQHWTSSGDLVVL